MSQTLFGRKPMIRRVALILALLMLVIGIALPAGASPPQELNFELHIVYADIPSLDGAGTWSATGLFNGSGTATETYHTGGWDGCFRTSHTTSVLTGPTAEDTITVRSQIVRIDAAPGCDPFTAEANWVILDATGIYEGLHGQGNGGTVSGHLDFNAGGPDLVVDSVLTGGRGHQD